MFLRLFSDVARCPPLPGIFDVAADLFARSSSDFASYQYRPDSLLGDLKMAMLMKKKTRPGSLFRCLENLLRPDKASRLSSACWQGKILRRHGESRFIPDTSRRVS